MIMKVRNVFAVATEQQRSHQAGLIGSYRLCGDQAVLFHMSLISCLM